MNYVSKLQIHGCCTLPALRASLTQHTDTKAISAGVRRVRKSATYLSIAPWSTGGDAPVPIISLWPALGTPPSVTMNKKPGPGENSCPSRGAVTCSVFLLRESVDRSWTSFWSMCTPCVANPRSISDTEYRLATECTMRMRANVAELNVPDTSRALDGRSTFRVNVLPKSTVAGTPLTTVGRLVNMNGGDKNSILNEYPP